MINSSIQLALYEISMSIGNSLDIDKMLSEFITTVLSRLNCSSASIYRYENDLSELFYVKPKVIVKNAQYQKCVETLSQRLQKTADQVVYEKNDGKYFYVFELKNFGFFVLTKLDGALDELLIQSLKKINLKLVNAVHACLSHSKLSQAVEQAQMASKAKAQFLANMSHEIRTPMNALIGMTSLALEEELGEKAKNYIQKANISAENLLGIINDILDFSKIEAGKLHLDKVHFKLSEVIGHTLHIINFNAKEKSIKIKVKVDADVPKYYFSDSLRLGQILTNLANNAVKFSHNNSEITIGVFLVKEYGNNAVLEFYVEDSGIGISKEHQEKLFESFSQAESSTTRKFGGTGLGLAISKKITQLMDGEIWVESTEGLGSKFSFTVIMEKSDEESIADIIEESKEAERSFHKKLQNKRILLVEDNEFNQELAIDLLQKKGIVVTVANNGQEALDILEMQNFDIVLMDIQMPIMDGYTATKRIKEKEQYKDLPILAMSANAMKEDRDRSKEVGMNDHIAKPLIPQEMFFTIEKWIS